MWLLQQHLQHLCCFALMRVLWVMLKGIVGNVGAQRSLLMTANVFLLIKWLLILFFAVSS